MNDVTIQPFGRSLVAITLGTMKYKQVQLQKATKQLNEDLDKINQLKADEENASQISVQLTTQLIDKRYKSSKSFMEQGDTRFVSQLQYKKSTTKSQKELRNLSEKQVMIARQRTNRAVSSYNKRLETLKANSMYRRIDFKEIT